MCTAVTFQTNNHYFGRNLDLEYRYKESVTITPRNFPFQFRNGALLKHHYGIIGIATIAENYPLYYDGTNECGLSMAGLNFPGNAVYQKELDNSCNISPFEFIPWILSQCTCVDDAVKQIEQINLVSIPFSAVYPLSPLHWIIADRTKAITVEPIASGLKIYDNPVGVLTNNPPFDYHLHNLNNYLNLTREEPTNRFSSKVNLSPYSRGMGALGLPGDLSSQSRFVRAVFTKLNSVCGNSEDESVSQFFHILESVSQQSGCVCVGDGFEKTIYSGCCNCDKGIYYYKTYENSQVVAIDMYQENLNSTELISYPLITTQNIYYQNRKRSE